MRRSKGEAECRTKQSTLLLMTIIMIDNCGRHLRGCPTCNEWRNSAGNPVKLSVEDLAALHALRRK